MPVWVTAAVTLGFAVAAPFLAATFGATGHSTLALVSQDIAGVCQLAGGIALGVGFYTLTGRTSSTAPLIIGGVATLVGTAMHVVRSFLFAQSLEAVMLGGPLWALASVLVSVGLTLFVLGLWKPRV